MTWVLEQVFAGGDCLRDAAERAGHRIVDWSDDWWDSGLPPFRGPVMFHGSLENADRIARRGDWKPGAYCQTKRFHCSAWYDFARQWLLHEAWEILPASRFVAESAAVLTRIGAGEAVFVRPDSPLKPFSGRVLNRDRITLAALDHGFYYEDAELPIVAAPLRTVDREWRYVVVNGNVITGSAYFAARRKAAPDDPQGSPWQFAMEIAHSLPPPEDVYVLDVCESAGALRLLELNPFSGADLYTCTGAEIVREVAAIAERTFQST